MISHIKTMISSEGEQGSVVMKFTQIIVFVPRKMFATLKQTRKTIFGTNGISRQSIITGWWYTYPSEK